MQQPTSQQQQRLFEVKILKQGLENPDFKTIPCFWPALTVVFFFSSDNSSTRTLQRTTAMMTYLLTLVEWLSHVRFCLVFHCSSFRAEPSLTGYGKLILLNMRSPIPRRCFFYFVLTIQASPSLFQALRQWGRSERKGHVKSWRGGKSVLPFYFRVCAFSIQRTRLSRSLEKARLRSSSVDATGSQSLARMTRSLAFKRRRAPRN